MKRRDFLQKMIGGWAAGTLSGATVAGFPTAALANQGAWGQLPSGVWGFNEPPLKVLEIFLSGGLSQWETFYVLGGCAPPPVPNWFGADDEVVDMEWICDGAPNASDEVRAFSTDSLGNCVYWGPATRPVWDLMDKSRMITCNTPLGVHELAGPFSMTGRPLAHPRLAGLGAIIQHYWMDRQPRALPYSYVLDGGSGVIPQARAAAIATGQHPGYSTPLLIRLDQSAFKEQLERANITPEADALFEVYRRQYRDLLRWQGQGAPLRSNGYAAYEAAAEFLSAAPELETVFGGDALTLDPGEPCADLPIAPEPAQIRDNSTKRGLELAAYLLDKGGARHVMVTDRGLFPSNNGRGYDTHGDDRYEHMEITTVNLFNMLQHLRRLIDPSPGGLTLAPDPGEQPFDRFPPLGIKEPARIRLNDTVIRIFSEFGRQPTMTPFEGSDRLGREHWTSHFNLLISNHVGGRQIIGGYNEDGRTVAGETDYGVQDIIGGLAVGAHVNPFAPENFANGEFNKSLIDQGNEHDTTLELRNVILGS